MLNVDDMYLKQMHIGLKWFGLGAGQLSCLP